MTTPDEVQISMVKAFPMLKADALRRGHRKPLEKKNMIVQLNPLDLDQVLGQLSFNELAYYKATGLFRGSPLVSLERVSPGSVKFDYRIEVT